MFLLSCSLKQKKENDEQQTHIHRRRSDLREWLHKPWLETIRAKKAWTMSSRNSARNSGQTNTFISVHIPVLDTNWIPDGQPNREKPNPIQPLPANNFYIIHHSPNTIRDIGSTSWYIYFPMKANERNIVTVITKKSIAQITERQKLPRIRSFLSSTTNFPLPFFE